MNLQGFCAIKQRRDRLVSPPGPAQFFVAQTATMREISRRYVRRSKTNEDIHPFWPERDYRKTDADQIEIGLFQNSRILPTPRFQT